MQLCKTIILENEAISTPISGFTLIELIAVISIISMMLFFAIPRLENGHATGDLKTASRWILSNVQSLKSKSVNEQKQFVLLVSFEKNSFSIVDESVSEENSEAQQPDSYPLPAGVTVSEVEFPGKGIVSSGNAEIGFYKKGYSDKALVHLLDESGTTYSILIEPFLPSAKLFEEYKSFF